MKKSTLFLGLTLLGVLALASTAFGYMGGFGMGGFGMGGFGMMGRYGMMGGYRMMGGFGNPNSNYQTIDTNKANDAMNTALQNAAVDKTNNTITFNKQDVNITLLGGPEYADEKFVVGSLVNPTIKVVKGAKVTLNFINEDEGMLHGIEVITSPPPYAYMSMMQGPIYPGAYVPVIPQAEDGNYPNASATFVASQSGTYYYICQVPGHAAKGMYGKIIIQ